MYIIILIHECIIIIAHALTSTTRPTDFRVAQTKKNLPQTFLGPSKTPPAESWGGRNTCEPFHVFKQIHFRGCIIQYSIVYSASQSGGNYPYEDAHHNDGKQKRINIYTSTQTKRTTRFAYLAHDAYMHSKGSKACVETNN